MRNLSNLYPGRIDSTQTVSYPWGKPRNCTSDATYDGTPWDAEIASDMTGWMQALLSAANMTPNDVSERKGASQILTALDYLYTTTADRTQDKRTRQISNLVNALGSCRSASSVVPSGENVLATGLVTIASNAQAGSYPDAREIPVGLIRNAAGYLYVTQIGPGTQLGSTTAATVTAYSTAAILPMWVGANSTPVAPYVIAGTAGGQTGIHTGRTNSTALAKIHASTVLLGAGYKVGCGYIIATADATTIYVHYSADFTTWTTRSLAHGFGSAPSPMPSGLQGTVQVEAQQGTTADGVLWVDVRDGVWCCICKHPTIGVVARIMLGSDNATITINTVDPNNMAGILFGAIASRDPMSDGTVTVGAPASTCHYCVVSDGTDISINPTVSTSSFSTAGSWNYVLTGLPAGSITSVGITIHEGRRIAIVTTRDGKTHGWEYGNNVPVFYGVAGMDNMRTYQSACRSTYGFVGTATVNGTTTLYAAADSRLRNDYAHGAVY